MKLDCNYAKFFSDLDFSFVLSEDFQEFWTVQQIQLISLQHSSLFVSFNCFDFGVIRIFYFLFNYWIQYFIIIIIDPLCLQLKLYKWMEVFCLKGSSLLTFMKGIKNLRRNWIHYNYHPWIQVFETCFDLVFIFHFKLLISSYSVILFHFY